ncbi:unnamed protein product [Lactuca virosa]|uniref:non-specific serine/threonine protein kinase n=1 Tax=Lactuca virosa TaxID=75947 RepID=A0AAU9MUP6_9ASTR|nr:unnamed protein product [Lactuca virosa]
MEWNVSNLPDTWERHPWLGSRRPGVLPGLGEVAVKGLAIQSGQGLKEIKNEVVLIGKLQHRNLVRLLGYNMKDHEMILLYEYMPNKSLDHYIFDRTLCVTLDWDLRFDIIMGIARGLLYLHQDSRLRIIHRDLKASNVLLDEDMRDGFFSTNAPIRDGAPTGTGSHWTF